MITSTKLSKAVIKKIKKKKEFSKAAIKFNHAKGEANCNRIQAISHISLKPRLIKLATSQMSLKPRLIKLQHSKKHQHLKVTLQIGYQLLLHAQVNYTVLCHNINKGRYELN